MTWHDFQTLDETRIPDAGPTTCIFQEMPHRQRHLQTTLQGTRAQDLGSQWPYCFFSVFVCAALPRIAPHDSEGELWRSNWLHRWRGEASEERLHGSIQLQLSHDLKLCLDPEEHLSQTYCWVHGTFTLPSQVITTGPPISRTVFQYNVQGSDSHLCISRIVFSILCTRKL